MAGNGAQAGSGEELPRDEPERGKPEQNVKPQAEQPRRTSRWPWIVVGLVVLGFVVAVLVIVFRPRANVWTDDARVMVHYATVAPRVAGQIDGVAVNDNQRVSAGQLLATIDPRDYQQAVATAEGMLAQDRARSTDADASLSRQPPVIDQQQAAVARAQARLAFARADARRFSNLAAAGAGTGQQHQLADSTLAEDTAALDGAEASLRTQRRQVGVLQAQKNAAEAAIRTDEARVAQARLNLSYTRITAPLDGVVGERSVQVGDYVAPGGALMVVVPLRENYVEANYREVDLRHVRPGQHASIHVDAYDIVLDGVVQSVPPATGATFAPIAPSNATGNFTKVVQRLPVKIVVAPGQPLARLLRVGLSVETTIHTGLADVVDEQARHPDAAVVGN